MSRLPTAQSSLPIQLTRFVGREREIAEVRQLLESCRLLTVTGAGGSGKTRLVIEAASRYPGEIVWVDLAPLLEPELVPEHVAAALGVRQEGMVATSAVILAALRDRQLLLVLDNCEHLVEAASGLADVLLRGCPDVQILATSREALGVGGEVAWLLPLLSLPAADAAEASALAGSEAVDLFVARARDVLPSFAPDDVNAGAVARICRRLDGLPLAIELAAARVTVLAPDQIAARLSDRFTLLSSRSRSVLSRHRTLQEVIGWSYNLLTGLEQELLQRLSVFAGGFSLDAVEEVCGGDGIEAEAAIDLIAALVAKSLVTVETGRREARYRLLETVQHFARDRLEAGRAERIRRRHAHFFHAGAMARERHVFAGGADPAHLEWFESELGELRAAAEWFENDPEGAADGLRLATTLEWFWFVRGRSSEGRRWLERALHRGAEADDLSRARALTAAGLLAFSQGDVIAQREAAEGAVSLLREADAPGALAHALSVLGPALGVQGDPEGSAALMEEAVQIARASEAPELVTILALQGTASAATGERNVPRVAWEEAARLARADGLVHCEPHLTDGLGRLAFEGGDHAAARMRFRQTLEIHVDDPWCTALALQGGGCVALMEGAYTRAAELLGAAAAMRTRISVPPRPDEQLFLEGLVTACRDALGDSAFAPAWQRGSDLGTEEALESARAVVAEPPGPVGSATGPPAGKGPTGYAGIGSAGATGLSGLSGLSGPAGAANGHAQGQSADLAVRALGALEITMAGIDVTREPWSQGRPRELLLLLLCHPEGRTREQVGLVFWPEATSAQVKNSFHVLLHRLRKGLNDPDVIVLEDGHYRINRNRTAWFDAATFEQELSVVLRQLRAGENELERLERTLELYRGDFSGGEFVGHWHLEVHDRLRRLYVDGLGALADLKMEAGDFRRAAEILEVLTRKEELREDAVRRLMLCLVRMNQRDRALRQYARLVELLRDELDAEPEPETQELAERLRARAPLP